MSFSPTKAAEERRPGAGGSSTGFSWRFTAPLFMGSALNPVNSSLIATALVPIAHGVHVSVGRTAALVSALYLASAVAQPTAGKLSEVFGPRRVFLAGICLVLAGGVVGGAGQSLGTLILARVLIGVGTSGGYPSAMLLIRRRAAEIGLDQPPGGVLGGLQIAGTATAALGLPIGGVLVAAFGWRATFLINVPVTLLALILTVRGLPRDPAISGPLSTRFVITRIDLAGILAFAGAISAFLFFLNSLPHPDWIVLAAAIVLALVLVGWELHAEQPFLDLRLLATNRALTRTYLRFGLTSLCVYTILYGLSTWLEAARGFSASEAGLLVLPMAGLAGILMMPISRRNLVRSALIVSAISSTVGSIAILLLSTGSPIIAIVAVTLIFGITLGTFAPANQTALYTQAVGSQIGTAAGLLRTFGYVGSIASSAIISVVFHKHVTDHGLHTVAVIMIAVSAVGLLFALADRRLRTSIRAQPDPPPPSPRVRERGIAGGAA